MRLTVQSRTGEAIERGPDGAWHVCEGDEITLVSESAHPAEARLSGFELPTRGTKRREGSLVTTWVVPIHTWAGRAEIEVHDDESRTVGQLDVSPHPGKLGIEAFREMIDELSRVNRDLPWGMAPGTLAAERDEDSPSIVHPSVLEAEMPALLDALRHLRRDPLQRTLRSREIAPLRGARHIDARSLRWLAARPRALVAITQPARWMEGSEDVIVEQRRTEHTLRHPATAHIRFLVDRLVGQLEATERSLRKAGSIASEEGLRGAWLARRVERWRLALAEERKTAPLCLVEPAPASEGAAQAILDHPVYARVQRVARRLLDPGLRVSNDGSLAASARRTHELYEMLVLLRLVEGLRRALGDDWTWTAPSFKRAGALEVLPDGASFVARSRGPHHIEVRHQATFSAYSADGSQPGSHALSGERRPDAVVGFYEGDKLVRWISIDAKYRASRPSIHEGLADVHVYQDALRWHGLRASGSYIAVPACVHEARVYTTRGYLEEHRFGALVTSAADCFEPAFDVLLDRRRHDEARSR